MADPFAIDSLAFARWRTAAAMLSGEPVITVGKKRVTPLANIARMESEICS